MKRYEDGLDDLREQNLRDPIAHAGALFAIEGHTDQIAGAANRAADALDEHSTHVKEWNTSLTSFLLQQSNHIPDISRSLKQIKLVLFAIAALLVVIAVR